jgi:MATE family multidrug resistance protein
MVGIALHVVWLELLVVHFKLDIIGIGIAVLITECIVFGLLLGFTHYLKDLQNALIRPDSRVFEDLRTYLSIALPSYVMQALDNWIWELMVLISGYLGVQEQAATIIIMQIVVVSYLCSTGFEQAAATLVGQQIGKGDLKTAKAYYRSIQLVSGFSLMITCVSIFIMRDEMINIFTKDPKL